MTTRGIIAFFFLLAGQILSQPTPQWSSTIGANYQYYFSHLPKIKFDRAGDLIVCASVMNGSNGRDMLLMKYTKTGNLLWTKNYNSVSNKDDEAISFEIDNQNNIYVTGTTKVNTNNHDVVTVKFDSGGNVVWTNSFNGFANRNDMSQSISFDSSYNAYITGSTELDTTTYHSYLFLRKIDSTGSTVWTKRYGSDSLSQYFGYRIRINNNDIRVLGHYVSMTSYARKFVALKLDLNGNVLLANETTITSGISSKANFIDKLGNYYFGSPVTYKTTKVDQNGTLAWTDSVPTNLPWNVSAEVINDITVDSLQNIYTTGIHYGTGTSADILTVKYSGSGSRLWSKRYDYLGGSSVEIGNTICLDSMLNVYVGGQSQGLSTGYDYDYAVIKYNSSGMQLGTIRYDSPASENDAVTSIQVDELGCIYITGITVDVTTAVNATTQKYCTLETGVDEYSTNNVFLSAFPNPFQTETVVELPDNNTDHLQLIIYNSLGQVIFEHSYYGTNALKINLSSLNSGLYYFAIKSANKHYSGKLIKME